MALGPKPQTLIPGARWPGTLFHRKGPLSCGLDEAKSRSPSDTSEQGAFSSGSSRVFSLARRRNHTGFAELWVWLQRVRGLWLRDSMWSLVKSKIQDGS